VSVLGTALAPMRVHAQGRGTPRDVFGDTARLEARRREPVAAPRPVGATGTYLATSIDREALPLRDQVVDEDGAMYLVEFDRLVLALRGDKTFRASVRFRRTLYSADPRSRARGTPLQNMTVTGTYEITDREIRFTPDPSKETQGLRMLAGRVRSATELEVPFQYRNGTRQRDRTLVMTRRDDIL
jgi:hypothetical protein